MRWFQGTLRRQFTLSTLGLVAIVAGAQGQSSPLSQASTRSGRVPGRITSEHHVLSRLGPEHLANAVYRKGADGKDYVVAWGDRVLQWPLEKGGAMQEVYPQQGDLQYTNGGCAYDVDQDGVDEIVTGRGRGRSKAQPELVWLDEVEGKKQFELHTFARLDVGGWAAPHDMQPLEVKRGDRLVRGLVYNVSRRRLYFAEIARDAKAEWPIHEIGSFPDTNQSGMEIADINGDGRDDIISGMFWVRTPRDPRTGNWRFYRYGEWNENKWAGMTKHEVQDMDGDGVAEIVVTEAEIPDSRLAIFQRGDDPAEMWETHLIDKGLYVPHSLQVTDADGDGDNDMIAGEMTAGGWSFPLNEKPTIWIYANRGNLDFDKYPLAQGEGVHEMKLAPVKIDGKQVLFAADEIQPWKFPDMDTHVGFWLVVPPDASAGK